MPNPIRLARRVVAGTVFAVLGAVASAQSTPATTSSSSAPKQVAKDEPVVLSEFTVTSKQDDSYIASESVTGSRVATKIEDLPFSVNVITSEFMNDFDFFEISDDVGYTSSLTGLDTQGNYNLRGFGATFQLRNGFYRLGLVDRVNVDRIEIIKGPNAAIYGQTAPSGLVNIISKRPTPNDWQRVSFTTGSRDMMRGELNVNGSLGSIGKVGVAHILSASAMNHSYDAQYAYLRQRSLSDAVLFTLNDHSTVLAELEWSKRAGTPDVTTVPYYVNANGDYTNRPAFQLKNFNQAGPTGEQNREMTTGTVTYENRLNHIWSTRVSSYAYGRHATNFNTSAGSKYDEAKQVITSRNPLYSILNEDGAALQADLLAHYWIAHGKLENKTLVTFDWSSNWRYRHETKPLSSIYKNSDISVVNPVYDVPSKDLFNVVSRNDKTRNDVMGVYLRQQTAMLNGRLIAFGGLRYDHVTFNLWFGDQHNAGGKNPGSVSKSGYVDHFTDSAWSPSVGFNYKLTPHVALFVNYSESFFPNAQSSKLGDPRLPNETASGWDFGVKTSVLNDRLVFTLAGFAIDRNGVKTTVREGGNDVDVAAGEQRADGIEFDFTWQATEYLTLLGGYGYTDARVVFNGEDTDSVGRPPSGVPVDNGGLAVRYRLPFRGWSATLGIKYIGEAHPDSIATVGGGNPDLARRDVISSSYTLVDAGISYRWTTGSRNFSHSLRLSAKNLFNRDYVTYRFNAGESRGVYLSYTLKH